MFVMVGLLALTVLVYWVLRSPSGDVKRDTEGLEAQDIRACLQFEALAKPFVERIFSEQDWAFISGRTNRETQRLFRMQRRRLAILWLRRTRKQVVQLMTFYRAAVRQKIYVSPAVEIRVVLHHALFVLTYYLLLVTVWLRGPVQARKMVEYGVDVTKQLVSRLVRLFSVAVPGDSTPTEMSSADRLIVR